MTNEKKRTYNSENRNAMAALTRDRVLAAARTLFQTEGFERVTIEKIAQTADVSTPTVYSLFQSKRGVLFALMDASLPADQIDALVEEVRSEKCPKKRIALAAKIGRQVYDSERAQMDIFRGAAVLAPEFKELENQREQRRYLRQEETIKTMWKEKVFIKGLSQSQVRDILWAFTGRDFYRMLVLERGWTPDEYEKWLGELLVKTLIREDL